MQKHEKIDRSRGRQDRIVALGCNIQLRILSNAVAWREHCGGRWFGKFNAGMSDVCGVLCSYWTCYEVNYMLGMLCSEVNKMFWFDPENTCIGLAKTREYLQVSIALKSIVLNPRTPRPRGACY